MKLLVFFFFFFWGGGGFTRLFSMLLCWFLVLLALHCDHVPTYSLGICAPRRGSEEDFRFPNNCCVFFPFFLFFWLWLVNSSNSLGTSRHLKLKHFTVYN